MTNITLADYDLHLSFDQMLYGLAEAADDAKWTPNKKEDSPAFEVNALYLMQSPSTHKRVAGTPVLIELQPVHNSFWPGGDYDKGERPKGEILNVRISDTDGNTLLAIENAGVTVQALAKAKTLTAVEKLLFAGNDEFLIAHPGQVVHAWGGRDKVTFSEGAGEAHGGSGNDTIQGDYILSSGKNRFYGDAGNDTLIGSDDDGSARSGIDRLDGGSGNDKLYGNYGRDILIGGAGNDFLDGGRSADVLTGGAGNDTFHFAFGYPLNLDNMDSGLAPLDRDRITDFERGADKISVTGGSTELEFIGTAAFEAGSGSNQARYERTSHGITLYFDVNQDALADWAIDLDGVRKLAVSDFQFG